MYAILFLVLKHEINYEFYNQPQVLGDVLYWQSATSDYGGLKDRLVLTIQIERLALLRVFSTYVPQNNIRLREELSKYDTGITIFWCMVV